MKATGTCPCPLYTRHERRFWSHPIHGNDCDQCSFCSAKPNCTILSSQSTPSSSVVVIHCRCLSSSLLFATVACRCQVDCCIVRCIFHCCSLSLALVFAVNRCPLSFFIIIVHGVICRRYCLSPLSLVFVKLIVVCFIIGVWCCHCQCSPPPLSQYSHKQPTTNG